MTMEMELELLNMDASTDGALSPAPSPYNSRLVSKIKKKTSKRISENIHSDDQSKLNTLPPLMKNEYKLNYSPQHHYLPSINVVITSPESNLPKAKL